MSYRVSIIVSNRIHFGRYDERNNVVIKILSFCYFLRLIKSCKIAWGMDLMGLHRVLIEKVIIKSFKIKLEIWFCLRHFKAIFEIQMILRISKIFISPYKSKQSIKNDFL